MNCAPQRFLANNRNLFREAILTPSAVRPVADQVKSIKRKRDGTAQVALTGEFSGTEEAVYDVEITDAIATVARTSAPIFSGAGSGSLENIVATMAAQEITVELHDVGIPTTFASADFEGVQITARASGPGGNLIHINIDQTGLVFSATTFSLLEDLKKGEGGPTQGIEGPAFDWDAAVVGDDDIIPSGAHRLIFGDDTSAIYLQYKRYVDGVWLAYFVPELKRDIKAGTVIRFVTGGRTVVVTDGVTPETYNGVVTLYDFLNDLKTSSALVTVDGVVANDRTPTGQAAQELKTRTDAYVQPSTGSGSAAARGFDDTFAGGNAATELVTAECWAVTSSDDPRARLGAELWDVKGSVSGEQGTDIVTGQPYTEPSGRFGFTIPERLPIGHGTQRGRFSVTALNLPRTPPTEPPPICVVAMKLGTEASDQTITLTYTKRPSGACLCDKMPIPIIGGACLGIGSEGGAVDYSPDARLRVKALYDLGARIVMALTDYVSGSLGGDGIPDNTPVTTTGTITKTTQLADGSTQSVSGVLDAAGIALYPDSTATSGDFADVKFPDSLQALFDDYETALQTIDAVVDTALFNDGLDAWDDALQALDDDLGVDGSPPLVTRLETLAVAKYQVLLRKAIAYTGVSPLGKSDAGILESGDGCWRDWKDAFYWTVVGAKGAYAPAFNNRVYYSSRPAGESGRYFSTHEFGFQINIKCPEQLQVGDEIILTIGDAGWGATYQVGDLLTLPIIGARDLYLVGGQTGNDLLVWYVTGSVSGPLGIFTFDRTAPTPYIATGVLEFDLVEGGIPFEKGDTFRFSVEGGHFRWRKDGGAWSAPVDIPLAAQAFDAGLFIDFETGASPSFVPGDTFSFRALQPWAVSNVRTPLPNRWEWGDDTSSAVATLVADCGSVEPVEAIMLALHTLPAGTTITIEAGTVAGIYPFLEAVTWRQGVIFHELSTPQNARYLRLTINDAEGAGIGWSWAGQPLTQVRQAEGELKRSYRVQRAEAGLFQGGRYSAQAVSGLVEWTEGALTEADVDELKLFMDWVKSNDDEPFVFVPQNTRPHEAFLERLVLDEVPITDVFKYGKNVAHDRAFSVSLPLSGVWQ